MKYKSATNYQINNRLIGVKSDLFSLFLKVESDVASLLDNNYSLAYNLDVKDRNLSYSQLIMLGKRFLVGSFDY